MKKTRKKFNNVLIYFLISSFCIAILISFTVVWYKQENILEQQKIDISIQEKYNEFSDGKLEDLQKMIDYSGTEEFLENNMRDSFGWMKDNEVKFKENRD